MEISFRRLRGAILVVAASMTLASCVSAPVVSGAARTVAPPTAPEPVVAEAAPVQREFAPLVAEALAALDAHAANVPHRDKIAVVDFSLPSSEPRFHLVDVATGRIERSWLVAHGSGSDPAGTGMVQEFSNQPGSNATSRGAYLTANPYQGKYGRSQRLIGLDADNYMAMDRAIVIHGAPYVDPELIARQGRIGRSQGCFAFELDEVAEVMDLLGEGRMIYAGKAPDYFAAGSASSARS
jgi:hypothetical protein